MGCLGMVATIPQGTDLQNIPGLLLPCAFRSDLHPHPVYHCFHPKVQAAPRLQALIQYIQSPQRVGIPFIFAAPKQLHSLLKVVSK